MNGRIFIKFDLSILRKSGEKIQISSKSDKSNGTLHEDQYTFLIVSRSLLLRMRNVLDKSCRGTQNTHFMFSNIFFENRAAYEICGKILLNGAGYS
jgi:hypothetical protein